MPYGNIDINKLIGKTFTSIDGEEGSDVLVFHTSDKSYTMEHHQDCCEHVYIEDINGDLSDLIDTPIVEAYESWEDDPAASESGTWSFFRFRTIKGTVVIRWYGLSNGYYCESAGIYES